MRREIGGSLGSSDRQRDTLARDKRWEQKEGMAGASHSLEFHLEIIGHF